MYNYEKEKPEIFTEKGNEIFLKIRDNVFKILKLKGLINMSDAIKSCSGSNWFLMACIDRMVELGEIQEVVFKDNRYTMGQDRMFILKTNNMSS